MGLLNPLTDKMSQMVSRQAGGSARRVVDKVMAGNTARSALGVDRLIAGNTARSGLKAVEKPGIDKVVAGNTARHGLGKWLDKLLHPSEGLKATQQATTQAAPWWQRPFAALNRLFHRAG